jgi:hypothetical protein
VMAAARTVIDRRSMTPNTGRIAIMPAQQTLQWKPREAMSPRRAGVRPQRAPVFRYRLAAGKVTHRPRRELERAGDYEDHAHRGRNGARQRRLLHRRHRSASCSSNLLRRIVGAVFMRVNAKCAHQVRPPPSRTAGCSGRYPSWQRQLVPRATGGGSMPLPAPSSIR